MLKQTRQVSGTMKHAFDPGYVLVQQVAEEYEMAAMPLHKQARCEVIPNGEKVWGCRGGAAFILKFREVADGSGRVVAGDVIGNFVHTCCGVRLQKQMAWWFHAFGCRPKRRRMAAKTSPASRPGPLSMPCWIRRRRCQSRSASRTASLMLP